VVGSGTKVRRMARLAAWPSSLGRRLGEHRHRRPLHLFRGGGGHWERGDLVLEPLQGPAATLEFAANLRPVLTSPLELPAQPLGFHEELAELLARNDDLVVGSFRGEEAQLVPRARRSLGAGSGGTRI
jgi:hypothetical protein